MEIVFDVAMSSANNAIVQKNLGWLAIFRKPNIRDILKVTKKSFVFI